MKLLKILSFVLLAVALLGFMRQMWITVQLRNAAPARLVASAKPIVPPERHPTPASTPAPSPSPAAISAPPPSSPLPFISPSPAGLAPLGRAPLQAPTAKPNATPFLDNNGNLRKAVASPSPARVSAGEARALPQ